jgi:hypothetical protein
VLDIFFETGWLTCCSELLLEGAQQPRSSCASFVDKTPYWKKKLFDMYRGTFAGKCLQTVEEKTMLSSIPILRIWDNFHEVMAI